MNPNYSFDDGSLFHLKVTIEKIEDDCDLRLEIDYKADNQTEDWLYEEFDFINSSLKDYDEIMDLELFEKYTATFVYETYKSWSDWGYEYDSQSWFDNIRKWC